MNAIMERWIGSDRRELLNRTLICNHEHLRQILHDSELRHNSHRPHMGLSAAAPLKPLRPKATYLTGLPNPANLPRGWGRQRVSNSRLASTDELFGKDRTQVANFLATADIGYHADFVAFDQWGQDFGVLRDPNPAGDIRYLNDAHWSNYLLYVQTIWSALNLPAVLWQIACGHLNSTQTPSPTYWNSSGKFPDLDDVTAEQDEDSASTFFFGDTFTSSGNNLAFYSSNPGADPKVSVNGSAVTWGSHMSEAAAAGVVVIMFGAGTDTGTYGVPEMVGTNQSTPSDFDYWVTRAQSYLANPTALP